MALRIITCSCVLAVLAASLARGGSVDVQPLGQLTRLYGGPIREYPQQVIVRLNDLSRGPILINPQDALQRSDTLPGADLLPGPVRLAPTYWAGLQEPRLAIQSTTRQSIQRRSGSTPARPMNPKCPPCNVVSHSTAADD